MVAVREGQMIHISPGPGVVPALENHQCGCLRLSPCTPHLREVASKVEDESRSQPGFSFSHHKWSACSRPRLKREVFLILKLLNLSIVKDFQMYRKVAKLA